MNDLSERYFSMQYSLFPMVEEEIGELAATRKGFFADSGACSAGETASQDFHFWKYFEFFCFFLKKVDYFTKGSFRQGIQL